MPLTLVDAQKAITGAHAKAGQLEIRVTAAIVDEGGLLIALGRMAGAVSLTPQIAEAKAVGAAMLQRDGAGLAELAKDRPGFFRVADRLVRVPIVPGLGSVLIRRDGKVVGAMGVSGGRPEQDGECAEAGPSSILFLAGGRMSRPRDPAGRATRPARPRATPPPRAAPPNAAHPDR